MYDHLSEGTSSNKRADIWNPQIFPVKSLQTEPLVNNHLLWATATTYFPSF